VKEDLNYCQNTLTQKHRAIIWIPKLFFATAEKAWVLRRYVNVLFSPTQAVDSVVMVWYF